MDLTDTQTYQLALACLLLAGFFAFDAGQRFTANLLSGVLLLMFYIVGITALPLMQYKPLPLSAPGVGQPQAAAAQGGFSKSKVRSFVGPSEIMLRRSFDGHFYAKVEVNGTPVRFVVDTGATLVVLSQRDARKAGLDPGELSFSAIARTANGAVPMAPVVLDEMSLNGVSVGKVRAAVNGGELQTSLLGMSYLRRYKKMEILGDRMLLIP